MTAREKKLLADINYAIDLIENFTAQIKLFSEYSKDQKTKSAVERQIAIIGEALNQFQKLPGSIMISNAHQIIALRNRLIHAYDNIDDAIIWAILKKSLAPLKIEIESLLSSS